MNELIYVKAGKDYLAGQYNNPYAIEEDEIRCRKYDECWHSFQSLFPGMRSEFIETISILANYHFWRLSDDDRKSMITEMEQMDSHWHEKFTSEEVNIMKRSLKEQLDGI